MGRNGASDRGAAGPRPGAGYYRDLAGISRRPLALRESRAGSRVARALPTPRAVEPAVPSARPLAGSPVSEYYRASMASVSCGAIVRLGCLDRGDRKSVV